MEQENTTGGTLLIAHLADTHLRDTQYVTTRRGLDFFEAARRAVTESCKKADILVIVGDIFDRPRPSPRVIGQLMQIDQILRAAGKAMLAVTGNHDWCEPTWLNTLFPGRRPEHGMLEDDASGIIPIDDSSVTFRGFNFAGIKPFSGAAFRDNLAEITVAAREADVVLYHNLVTGVVPLYAGLPDPLRIDEFPVSKRNKAWLLGDIHIQGYAPLNRPGGGRVLTGYPGSTEMCSSAEPTEKSVPLISLTQEGAEVEDYIPVPIRPFISSEVVDEEDLEALVERVSREADEHPVVIVKFDRSLSQTVNRLHSILDAQRAVIRCHPLPSSAAHAEREKETEGQEEEYGIDHFVSRRFDDDSELKTVALDLLARGDSDADGIMSQFIESRLKDVSVRESDEG